MAKQRIVLMIAAVACAALGGVVWASTVAPAAGTEPKTGSSGESIYTYTMTPDSGESVKDFHIVGAKIKGTGQGPSGWTASSSKSGMHFRKTSEGAQSGAATFTITVSGEQGKAWNDALVSWKTTSTGTSDPNDGVIDTGPGSGEPSTHGPVAALDHTGGTTAAVGVATTVSFDGTEPGRPFQLYLILTDEGCPDPWEAFPAFEQFVAEHPVPPAWGLGVVNGTGVLNADGDTPACKVYVPNTPSLVGQKFFVVAVAQGDDQCPAGVRVAGEPVEYTIVE